MLDHAYGAQTRSARGLEGFTLCVCVSLSLSQEAWPALRCLLSAVYFGLSVYLFVCLFLSLSLALHIAMHVLKLIAPEMVARWQRNKICMRTCSDIKR